MHTVYLYLINATSGILDKVSLEVNSPDSCEREVAHAMARQRWVLSVGDRIEIRERGDDTE